MLASLPHFLGAAFGLRECQAILAGYFCAPDVYADVLAGKLHRHKISDSTVDTRRGNAVLSRLPFARARVPSLSDCVLGGAFRFGAGVYRAFCTSTARQRRKPAHQPAPGIFGCICKRYAVCALLLPPADMARARMEEKPYFTACGADAASVQRCCHCVYVK